MALFYFDMCAKNVGERRKIVGVLWFITRTLKISTIDPIASVVVNQCYIQTYLQAAGLSHPTRGKVTPSQWKRWFSKKSPHREKVTPQHRF